MLASRGVDFIRILETKIQNSAPVTASNHEVYQMDCFVHFALNSFEFQHAVPRQAALLHSMVKFVLGGTALQV